VCGRQGQPHVGQALTRGQSEDDGRYRALHASPKLAYDRRQAKGLELFWRRNTLRRPAT
jgi:hypothetical protein